MSSTLWPGRHGRALQLAKPVKAEPGGLPGVDIVNAGNGACRDQAARLQRPAAAGAEFRDVSHGFEGPAGQVAGGADADASAVNQCLAGPFADGPVAPILGSRAKDQSGVVAKVR